MEQHSSSKIECSAALLAKTKGLLVITGAGISAESGIPTYRGPGGIFEEAPETQTMLSAEGLARDPDRLWKYFNELRTLASDAQPNPAHRILAQWEEGQRFPKFLIATQNIDGLHQKAGSKRVTELHGSIWQMACPRTVDYAEDEQFSDDVLRMMSTGNNEDILKRWSEENNQTIWKDRDVPFESIPPYHDPTVRPNILFFNESYGNRLLWVEDFIQNGIETILVIGCSGGVDILDRLLRQCRETNPDCAIININPHQDCIEHEHQTVPMKASAAMEGIETCLT
jgi:NAD-dependent SIR2 family protein deacetylase